MPSNIKPAKALLKALISSSFYTDRERANTHIDMYADYYGALPNSFFESIPQPSPGLGTLRGRRKRMPSSFLDEDTTKSQKRLLAAVDTEGKLHFVRYENNKEDFNNRVRDIGNSVRLVIWRIRKCPPHVASKLIAFDKTEDADINGHKAWEYIQEAGFKLRQL